LKAFSLSSSRPRRARPPPGDTPDALHPDWANWGEVAAALPHPKGLGDFRRAPPPPGEAPDPLQNWGEEADAHPKGLGDFTGGLAVSQLPVCGEDRYLSRRAGDETLSESGAPRSCRPVPGERTVGDRSRGERSGARAALVIAQEGWEGDGLGTALEGEGGGTARADTDVVSHSCPAGFATRCVTFVSCECDAPGWNVSP